MVMPNLGHVWTREEVLALPDDGNRYELIDGELLVSPSPELLAGWITWQSSTGGPVLTIDLDGYFAKVWGES